MKPNWQAVLFRVVVLIFCITVIGYEGCKALQNGLSLKELLSSDNGIIFALKFVAIPVSLAGALWWAINWVKEGVYAPKRNWDEGFYRVGILMFVILLIVIGVGVFI